MDREEEIPLDGFRFDYGRTVAKEGPRREKALEADRIRPREAEQARVPDPAPVPVPEAAKPARPAPPIAIRGVPEDLARLSKDGMAAFFPVKDDRSPDGEGCLRVPKAGVTRGKDGLVVRLVPGWEYGLRDGPRYVGGGISAEDAAGRLSAASEAARRRRQAGASLPRPGPDTVAEEASAPVPGKE